jgi:hypothetical protein
MINENTFFEIIETTLAYTSFENLIEYDEFLIKQLEQKTNNEIAQFHLRFLQLRRELDTFENNKVARKLGYDTSRQVFNRFCNGIIASGKDFYNQSKEGKYFLSHKMEKNPRELKRLYYEGLSMVSSAAYFEKEGLDADWDSFLRNVKRVAELEHQKKHTNELER